MRLQRWSRKRGMVWVGKDPFTLSNSLTGRGSQVGHPWAWATATPHPQGRIWLQRGQDTRSVQCSIPAWGGCGVTSQSSRRYQDWIAAASAGPATSAGLRPLAASSLGPVSPASPPASLCDLFGVHQLSHGWSSLCRDTLALLREHLGTLGAVWVPSTRQAGPGSDGRYAKNIFSFRNAGTGTMGGRGIPSLEKPSLLLDTTLSNLM